MSATISLASNSASERTDFRLTVQLLRRVRGMPMISNSTPRQSGCRSSALATRQRISSMVAGRFSQIASTSMVPPASARSGGGPSSRTIVGAEMVNDALRPPVRERMAQAMAGTETIIAAAKPSVRAGVLAAVVVSLVTLSIATFELSMGDFPSALLLMGIVPLAALLFFACLVWSASQLLRIRKDGVKFALPFAISVATLLALQYAPLQQIYLGQNFWRHRAERDRIVERVENGELTPNVDYNRNLIALARRD